MCPPHRPPLSAQQSCTCTSPTGGCRWFNWLPFWNEVDVTSALIHSYISLFSSLHPLLPPASITSFISPLTPISPQRSLPSLHSASLSHYTVTPHPASWWFSAARPSGAALRPFDFHPQTTKRRAHIQCIQCMLPHTPVHACMCATVHILYFIYILNTATLCGVNEFICAHICTVAAQPCKHSTVTYLLYGVCVCPCVCLCVSVCVCVCAELLLDESLKPQKVKFFRNQRKTVGQLITSHVFK